MKNEVGAAVAGLRIERIDHLVLTVREMELVCNFYHNVLGMEVQVLADGRRELKFGDQKINLQQEGRHYGPASNYGRFWNGNLCFITEQSMSEILLHLNRRGISIEDGPGVRAGARGPIQSVYVHDPEQNLIEISTYRVDGSLS